MYNLNLPKSLLESATQMLKKSESDFGIPEWMVENARKTAIKYKNCLTLEDQKKVVCEAYDTISKEKNYEKNDSSLVKYENAVKKFASE